MDALSDLYADLLSLALQHKAKSTIAYRIRQFVQDLSDHIGEKRVSLDVAHELANTRGIHHTQIDKSYFKKVVREKWNLETEEDGFVWIRLDKPVR
jgi:hypothetical protein